MLFKERFWPGIADGSVTLAFRRWKRPTVRADGTLQSPVGLLAIDSVDTIDESAISEADARRAGFESRNDLLGELGNRQGDLYRITFHVAGPDPRIALRERDTLSNDDLADVTARLARIDAASKDGPWTADVLRLISESTGTRAADLAAQLGEPDLARFKSRVRRLKNLGLTESLGTGYRISPRGRALLDQLR